MQQVGVGDGRLSAIAHSNFEKWKGSEVIVEGKMEREREKNKSNELR